MNQKIKHANFGQKSLVLLVTKKKKIMTIIYLVKKIQPNPESNTFLGTFFKANFRMTFESDIHLMGEYFVKPCHE